MKWYGLTGGIGSGKTTVAQILRKSGVPVVDADEISRDLTRMGTPCYHAIIQSFGRSILNPEGAIDRKKLGSVVFSNSRKLQELESILHPEVQKKVADWRNQKEQEGYLFAIYDVPLLFEKNLQKNFDKIISVLTSEETQIQRVLKRNPQLSREEVLQRIKSQVPMQTKRAGSHEVIENEGSLAELEKKVHDLQKKLEIKAQSD